MSGLRLFTRSTVASVPLKMKRLRSLEARRIIYLGKSARRTLSGIWEILTERPPSSFSFSMRKVVHPTSAAVHAASRPAVPPPMTTTLQGLLTLRFLYSSPVVTAGLTVQRTGWLRPMRWPAQPTLQEMHLRRSSSWPSSTLLHQSGSAIRPRPMPMRSASPRARISSATLGSRILPMVMQGLPYFSFTAFAM